MGFKETYKHISNLETYQVLLALEIALKEKKEKLASALGSDIKLVDLPMMTKVRWELFKKSLDSQLEFHRLRVERRSVPKITIEKWAIPFEKRKTRKKARK